MTVCFNLFLGLRRHGLFQISRGGELRTIIQTVITVVCRPCNDLLALLGTIERPSGPLLECWRKKGICTSSPRVSTLAVVLIVILLMKFGDRERDHCCHQLNRSFAFRNLRRPLVLCRTSSVAFGRKASTIWKHLSQ